MSNVLAIKSREGSGKGLARQIRREGLIPAVVYGGGEDHALIAVDPKELIKLLKASPLGRNSVLELQGDGPSWHVMVQEIQRDPLKRNPLHVDFRSVKDTDQVVVEVPVRRSGKSKAEEVGSRLHMVQRSVKVRCQVKDIPEAIVQDVSELKVGDLVRASALTTPPGVTVDFKMDYTVMTMMRPRGAAEEAAEGAAPGAPAATPAS